MTSKDNSFAGKKIGDDYDLFKLAAPHHDEFQQSVANEVRKYAREVKRIEPINVLEIGYGTGLTTERILQASPRVIVLGVDEAANMLKQAKGKLERYIQSKRLLLHKSEANEFFRSHGLCSNFDIVASAYTIHNLPDAKKRKLFGNIYQALVPGGILVEGDVISQDDLEEHQRELAIRLENLKAFDKIGKSDLRIDWEEHHAYDDQPGIRMTETELTEMLREAGFRDITKVYRKHMEATFVARK